MKAGRGLESLRELRDHLSDLSRMRRASPRVARRSAVWRSRTAPVVRESENAGQLDLLGNSCLMLTRTAIAAGEPKSKDLIPLVRELAAVLNDLAEDPGDRSNRQRAANRAFQLAKERENSAEAPGERLFDAAVTATRMAAADLMLFAGSDADEGED